MSDFGIDPRFDNPTDEEMMMQYMQMQGGIFGDNPAKRMNMLQDYFQTLGFNPIELAGTTPQAAPVPPTYQNSIGRIYGTDPVFGDIFNAIESNVDPISAVREAAKREGWTQDETNQNLQIATQYASERIQNTDKMAEWERENAGAMGGWTMPDGSKAKTAPLGGNDINATASEYELLGAPTEEELIAQYAGNRNPNRRVVGGQGVSASGGVGADGFGWNAPTPSAQTEKFDSAVAGVPSQFWAGAAPRANPRVTQPRTAGGGRFSDNPLVEKYAQKEAKGDTRRYMDKTKNQRVRSDANNAAMQRIMAMAAMMQGGYSG
jgi:hypothetical protein